MSDLLRMKQTVDEKKAERSRLEGQKQQLMSRLKDEFDINSVEEGRAFLERLETEIGEADQRLQELIAEIEENYEQLRE